MKMASPQGPFYRELGLRIRNARRVRRFTQGKLAEVLSLSRSSITNIETGGAGICAHLGPNCCEILACP